LYDENVPNNYENMPVTTTKNIKTFFGISRFVNCAVRLTIEDIEKRVKKYSDENEHPTFESFLNHHKN
jgi:hypothetical protein